MSNPKYVYVVRLHLAREGANASALFVSPNEDSMSDIVERAKAMGIEAEIDIDAAPMATKEEIIGWLSQFDRTRTPEPAIVRPEIEARVDELHRAQRNTDRKLDVIAGMLQELLPTMKGNEAAARYNAMPRAPGPPFAIPPDAVPPAHVEREPAEPQHVDRRGRGAHVEQGEQTQGAATRHLAQQVTGVAGVRDGNMALQGGSASSEVWGVGPNGEATKSALPKVGDTLKPPHLRNG